MFILGFPAVSVVKNPPAKAGDVGLIPGSGRSPGEGNNNSLQHSCLGNPMDRAAWGHKRVGHHLATKQHLYHLYKYTDLYVCVRRQWHPTPVLLPGKSHGWRSLAGCSPWGR